MEQQSNLTPSATGVLTLLSTTGNIRCGTTSQSRRVDYEGISLVFYANAWYCMESVESGLTATATTTALGVGGK